MSSRIIIPGAAISAVLALALSSSLANATISLTNRDNRDHKLTVIEDNGAKTTDHALKPSQVLEGICPQGCVIRLNDSQEDEYELEANDKVSIEDGYLYYDEPESTQPPGAGGAPATGSGGPTPGKK